MSTKHTLFYSEDKLRHLYLDYVDDCVYEQVGGEKPVLVMTFPEWKKMIAELYGYTEIPFSGPPLFTRPFISGLRLESIKEHRGEELIFVFCDEKSFRRSFLSIPTRRGMLAEEFFEILDDTLYTAKRVFTHER